MNPLADWTLYGMVLALAIGVSAVPAVRAGETSASPRAEAEVPFVRFHEKASAGKPVTVVFFGGSLTWGANASDPNRTSYRGRMGEYLRQKYPNAPIRLVDAAIGGTGSQLGLYRLERDVLAHRPDLVFIDFAINDGAGNNRESPTRTYETLLRRLIAAGVPTMQVYLSVKGHFGKNYRENGEPRVEVYRGLAKHYGQPYAETAPYIRGLEQKDPACLDVLWGFPKDTTHPDDPGYQAYFEAVRLAYEQALVDRPVARLADPLSKVYAESTRRSVVGHDLPKGWTREKTFRTAMWFDGLSSRWMGDVAVLDAKDLPDAEPLRIEFEGTAVGLFGEMNANGLDLAVTIDGAPPASFKDKPSIAVNTARMAEGGNLFYWRSLAEDLAPGKHVLELKPVAREGRAEGQFRIESVCFSR